MAFAITTLIRTERVDLALDLHEASPEYPVVNTIVAHQRATDLAALANLGMQAAGVDIGLEASPETLRGLSHREWGDTTPALAVLMETTNPAEGRLRGATNAGLVVEGRDRFYVLAAERRRLSVPFDDKGWPLAARVGRHLTGVTSFVDALGQLSPASAVELSDVPTYDTHRQAGARRLPGGPGGKAMTPTGWTEPAALALMLGCFGLLAVWRRWPIGVALVAAAWAGAAFAGDWLPARHLVEGAFSYLDPILVIATAMIFMRLLADGGALGAIGASVERAFGHRPALLLPVLMLIVMFPGMITGSSTASVLTTGTMAGSILVGLGCPANGRRRSWRWAASSA